MTVQELLSRLEGAKRAGGGWVVRCPGHDDRHASLSIGRGQDGKVLLNCHAGCAPGDIAAALGIRMAELFPDEKLRGMHVEATYDYRDERGALLFQVLRLAGKQFRQRKPAGGSWDWKLGDVRRVLYRLPDLVASADDERVVYVCEGEKDADALARLEMVATSNPGGAGKWRPEYSESLRGREVVVLPDNDKPGREHAEMVARALQDIALRVRVIALPGLPDKGDVSDWLAKGGDRAQLEQLVARAPAWEAADGPAASGPAAPDAAEGFVASADRLEGMMTVVRERAASSQPFRVGFLDDIAVGLLETDLVVLGAPTGAGKTTLAAIFAQHAAAAGARVNYFALEAHRNEIEMRMLFRIMSRLAWQRSVVDQPTLDAFTYRRWCHGLCESVVAQVETDALAELRRLTRTMSTFYRSGRFKTDNLVEQMLSVRGESDLIILDHLHYLDDGDDDEIRAMRRTVKAVSDTIQDARTPVIAIAHLRKMDVKSKRVIPHIAEFHGSSDITKVATMVITLAPVDRPRLMPWIADTYMHVSKDRLEGEQNFTAILGFDLRSNSYERGYELGRLLASGTKWEAVPIGELPWWAVNERRRMSWPS